MIVCSTYMSPCWGCLSTEPRSFAYRALFFLLGNAIPYSGFKFDPSKSFQHLVIPLNLHGLSLNCIEITVSAKVLALFHVNVPGFALLRSINSLKNYSRQVPSDLHCFTVSHLWEIVSSTIIRRSSSGTSRLQSHLWNKHPNLQLMFWS